MKVIYLVRDPRGTMNSRTYAGWCKRSRDCNNVKVVCDDLAEDFKIYQELKQMFPSTIRSVLHVHISDNIDR